VLIIQSEDNVLQHISFSTTPLTKVAISLLGTPEVRKQQMKESGAEMRTDRLLDASFAMSFGSHYPRFPSGTSRREDNRLKTLLKRSYNP
jgi:hypothetical protein